MTLTFQVKGSAAEPYKVRFERLGSEVRAFCSCPAGRNAGRFCKHVKLAVEGAPEVVGASAVDREALAAMVAGTALEAKAEAYVPPAKRGRIEGCATVAEVNERYREVLEAKGFVVEYSRTDGDFAAERLALFERFKNGKVRKGALTELTWDLMAYDLGVLVDGSEIAINVRPREKPFGVRGKHKSGQWADPAAALHAFLLNAGLVVA